MRKLLHYIPPVYSVTILPSEHGSITANPMTGIGKQTVILSNTADNNYVFDKYIINGATLYDGNKFDFYKSNVTVTGIFKLNILNQLDFLYQAKDLTNDRIPNKAANSSFGDYMKAGTLVSHETGADTYLTNSNNGSNYLYKDLTTAQLDAMKAINSTYTFFIRVTQDGGDTGTGGIVSWRYTDNNNAYVYMIRSRSQQLELHTTQGYLCGSNFSLTSPIVYKVVINGSNFYAKNLNNNAEYSLTYSTNRNMGTRMTTFFAGTSEYNLSKFYGLAGIARATTADEDEVIKEILTNQSA
ncbi:MAG: hypothetical protein J6S85_11105 [Methanobrevibacter sp.]|nr:hypothetical protein [Methanobrevibacter sp.]